MAHRLTIAVLAVAASAGCSPKAEKPPPVTCSGCGSPWSGIGGHVPPGDGMGGAAGETGTDDTPVRLEGDVRILNNISALEAAPFLEPAELLVEGATADVTGRWSGLEPTFSLDGVKRGSAIWAQATPGLDALPTLQPIDTRSPDASGVVTTALVVVRASELEAAFSVLSMPLDVDESKAQAVLVALKGGRPASGVRVRAPGALVIYVDNGAFTDTADSTDGSGIFLLANVAAVPWPGSDVALTLSGTVPGRFDLKLVSGAVTVGGVGN